MHQHDTDSHAMHHPALACLGMHSAGWGCARSELYVLYVRTSYLEYGVFRDWKSIGAYFRITKDLVK